MIHRFHVGLLVVLGLTANACGLPHDAEGSLDRIRGGVMRVGIIVDTPWVTDSAGGAGGIEGALVRSLAARLHARIDWIHGEESGLLQTLAQREIDLVIGGLTTQSPWKKQVALTRPYYTDTTPVGGAPGGAPPSTLDQLAVAVEHGDPVIATLRKKGARPALVPTLADVSSAVAAPVWRLAQLGRHADSTQRLLMAKHVLAASPGENAWLVQIETLLAAERVGVPRALRAMRR
jgi:polar amino acid transport system substrate-binding protein